MDAGTGKATRLFARAGITVTATDPDAAMLAELRRHVPAEVRSVCAAFEEVRRGERYGLVHAAASLHWTRPEGRWSRAAALLEPGGVFASFGGPLRLADRAVEDAVREARAPFLESDEIPSPDGTPPEHALQWPGTELRQSGRFTDVRQSVLERRRAGCSGGWRGCCRRWSRWMPASRSMPHSPSRAPVRGLSSLVPAGAPASRPRPLHARARDHPDGGVCGSGRPGCAGPRRPGWRVEERLVQRLRKAFG
ncbi:class I SAM-dependent methyltransferase [Streptomyces albidoflavus]